MELGKVDALITDRHHFLFVTALSTFARMNASTLLVWVFIHPAMTRSPTLAPPLRVLIADDIEASREHLLALVRALGHEAFSAQSGLQAVQQVVLDRPDVVLLDLLMPDLDGFEVTQRIRAVVTDRWLPVIVTSSLQGDEHFTQALHQGADDYLVRPINPTLLEAKLRHYGQVLGLQARLATLAQRQRVIMDNILDAVLTLDAQGQIQQANLAAARHFGQGTASLSGQACEQALGACLADLLSRPELSLRRSDGTLFPAEIARSEWTQDGRIQHTLVIRDLTERQRIDRMKDEFLATVSHELRTPLTSVLGALSLLACGAAGALPAPAGQLAEVARRNGARLGRLIDDILDLTKLEGNQMVLQLRPVQLDQLLKEALAANQGYAQAAQVRLCLDLATGSPQVRVDADRFLQAMSNLLSNAVKHSAAGDSVSVSMDWSPTGVRVKVRDQGPGIAPQFRARMFEKFSQADGSDRRAQGGTGLGLYITRMLVERMGGQVEVDSVAGAGATFILAFPLAELGVTSSGPRVLHIDCDIDARRRVAEWLAPLCVVVGATSASQGRELLGAMAPAAILADPQSQGKAEDFCAALRRLAVGCPVLLYSDSVDAAFVRRMGLGWLQKSGSGSDALLQAVRAAITPSRERKKS